MALIKQKFGGICREPFYSSNVHFYTDHLVAVVIPLRPEILYVLYRNGGTALLKFTSRVALDHS